MEPIRDAEVGGSNPAAPTFILGGRRAVGAAFDVRTAADPPKDYTFEMRQLTLIILAVLLLAGIGTVVWVIAGRPPVRMVWRYGISYGSEPTGRTLTVEGVEFVEIDPGCFFMGSDQGLESGDVLGRWCARLGLPWGMQPWSSMEMPMHWVEFSAGFWIARTELTNGQFEASWPLYERSERSPGDWDPVANVKWEEAKAYCILLSRRSGLAVRLPAESEWECACRAGSSGNFCFGDDEELLADYAWYEENSGGHAHAVGSRKANEWGLHDLHGNVYEWCEDTVHMNYTGAPANGMAWTEGGENSWVGTTHQVGRGGGFESQGVLCRSACRYGGIPGFKLWRHGFRPAFTAPTEN